MSRSRCLMALAVLAVLQGTPALAEDCTLKLGVLKFGTVAWELDTIKAHQLDEAAGCRLEITPLASKNATTVALQAEAVDLIVSDWIWVARQRAAGQDYSFVPFSTALGALVVPADSPIERLVDLKDKRLGIAGGPLDKSWLLLRGLAEETYGFDADAEVEKVFAAPPLLNEQLLSGRVDAVLNFWPYVARLEAKGLREVIGVTDMTHALGIESKLPLVGYVFRESWAQHHGDELRAFLTATQEAKALLAESDEEWERLRPLMKAGDEATFLALRDGFRAGIPTRWGAEERADAARLFDILAALGGEKLVGRAETLPDGTFWPGTGF